MIAGVWWTCALLAVVAARLYERCELASELQRLGVNQHHIPTWVCIAFHESRFDTAAHNSYSGDHGLLQISELYWCGAGKSCGVPCTAFRDDDISDDVSCALQIYREHTRLQGDGFLAWVVYAQHCKHNTKKYLADCDISLKNNTEKSNIGNQTSLVTLLRGSYSNELDQMNRIDYKIINIDELTLPVFNKILNPELKTTPVTAGKVPATAPDGILNNLFYSKTSMAPNAKNVYKQTSYTSVSTFPTTLRTPIIIKDSTIFPKLTMPESKTIPSTKIYKISSTTKFSNTHDEVILGRHYSSLSTTPIPWKSTQSTSTFKPRTFFKFSPVTRPRVVVEKIETTRPSSSPYFPSTNQPTTTVRRKTTQSIFDLYLNPTKRPKLAAFNFKPVDSKYKIKIFSDGTTPIPHTNII